MNMSGPSLPPVALIAGPTASGKSALALALAARVGGTIVNADSAQVYADLRIVSARPTVADETRIPHRLYGYRDGADPGSAADWAADARQAIREIHAQGRVPILVGGTGLYLRILLEGIAPVPPVDPAIREKVRALSVDEAFAALLGEDEGAAARLRPSDSSRIARALEVVRSTGRTLAQWQTTKQGGIDGSIKLAAAVVLPPRDWLYRNCERRFERIVEADGIAEVRKLLARGLDPALPVMRAIGVPEIAALLAGTLGRDEAVAAGQAATRRYAKRQYTWFSRQSPATWPRFTDRLTAEAIDDLADELRKKL